MRLKQAKTNQEESIEGRLKRLVRYVNAPEIDGFDRQSLDRLRDYADTWLACSSAQEWCAKFSEQWQSITETLTQTQLVMYPFPGPTKNFIRAWDWKQLHVTPEKDDRRKLDKLFADFLSESSDRLGVCKGCGSYFVNTPKRTDYCTEKCKSNATAREVRHRLDHLKWAKVTAAMRAVLRKHSGQKIGKVNQRREACMKTTKPNVSLRFISTKLKNANNQSCAECAQYIQAFLETER